MPRGRRPGRPATSVRRARPALLAIVVALMLLQPGSSRATAYDDHVPQATGPTVAAAAAAPPVQTADRPRTRLRTPGDDIALRPGREAAARAARPKAPRRIKLLAARVYVGSLPKNAVSTKDTKKLLGETATWYHNVSRGRQRMRSRLTRWIKLPMNKSRMCVTEFSMVPAAVRAIRRAGYGTGGVNRLMLLMPQCGGSSSGELGGPLTWIRDPRPDVSVMVHELGHNLGLRHANSAICRVDDYRVTLGKKCSSQEYGDLWDAMGISERAFSVGILARLGWAGRIVTPKKSGTFTLADSERSGRKVQGLRIVESPRRSYWLEYRTETLALGGNFKIEGSPGVEIRLDKGQQSMEILDALPGTEHDSLTFPDPDFVDVTLPVGSSFTTPDNTRITVTGQNAKSAQVRIDRGQRATAPGSPVLRAVIAQEGSHHDLYVDPPTSDGGQVLLGYQVTSLPSGKSLFVKDPAGLSRTLTGFLTVYERLGTAYSVRSVTQAGTSAPSATVTVRTPLPSAAITSPAPGAAIAGHDVRVTVVATPDPVTGSPITSVTACLSYGDDGCYYDDVVRDETAPYDLTVSTSVSELYTLAVVVTDEQGGSVTLNQPVTVLGSPPLLRLDSPADGATSDATIEVAGNASPNPTTGSPVDYVELSLQDVGGNVVAYDYVEGGGDGNFAVSLQAVPPGSYRLTVEAFDLAGDSVEIARSVTVVP